MQVLEAYAGAARRAGHRCAPAASMGQRALAFDKFALARAEAHCIRVLMLLLMA